MDKITDPYAIRRTKLMYWAKIRHNLVDLVFGGRRWIVYEGYWMCGNFGRMSEKQAIRTKDALNAAYYKGKKMQK